MQSNQGMQNCLPKIQNFAIARSSKAYRSKLVIILNSCRKEIFTSASNIIPNYKGIQQHYNTCESADKAQEFTSKKETETLVKNCLCNMIVSTPKQPIQS